MQFDEVVRNPAAPKSALEALPQTSSEEYRKLTRRVMDLSKRMKKLVFRSLSWILYARRILKMGELCDILKFTSRSCDTYTPNGIVEAGKGFIFYNDSNDTIRFIHSSVGAFLRDIIAPNDREIAPIDREIAPYLLSNVDLAIACSSYLASKVFDGPCSDQEEIVKRLKNHQFMRYAAQFWDFHTRTAEKYPNVSSAAIEFLKSENKRNAMPQMRTYDELWGDISFTKGQTLLHVIARNGLATICKLVLNEKLNGNDRYVLEVNIRV